MDDLLFLPPLPDPPGSDYGAPAPCNNNTSSSACTAAVQGGGERGGEGGVLPKTPPRPRRPQPPRHNNTSVAGVVGGGCSSVASASVMGGGARGGGGGGATAASATLATLMAEEEEWSQPHRHVGGLTDDMLQHCYDALSMIDPAQRKGWEQATAHCCPKVLAQESCPCYFMVACQTNPWDAAERLCTYWNERIDLFELRAFEAITSGSDDSSPTGLTPSDVKILETGCVQMMPLDRIGRSVYFADLSRLESHMHQDIKGRLRVLWYVLHKTFTNREPEGYRLVSLILCVRPERTGFDWPYAQGCMKIPTTLPIQTEDIHLLTTPASTGTGRMVQIVSSTAINMIGGFFQHLVRVHHGAKSDSDTALTGSLLVDDDPQERLLLQLRQYGLSKRGLPQCAGGNITLEAFHNWLKRQRRIEEQLYWSAAQRAQRKRDLNRVHSRQKRMRRHQEFHELQTEVSELLQKNERARAVHAELLGLLEQARDIVKSPSLYQVDTVPTTTHPPPVPIQSSPEDTDLSSQSLSHFLAALEPDPIAPTCHPKSAEFNSQREFDGLFECLETPDPLRVMFGHGCDNDVFHQVLPLPVSSQELYESLEPDPHAMPVPDKVDVTFRPSFDNANLLPSSNLLRPDSFQAPQSGALQQHFYFSQTCVPNQMAPNSNNVFNVTTTIQMNPPQPMHVTNCFSAGGEQNALDSSSLSHPTFSVAFHSNPVAGTTGETASSNLSSRGIPVRTNEMSQPLGPPASPGTVKTSVRNTVPSSSWTSWWKHPNGQAGLGQEESDDLFDDTPFDTIFG